MNYNKFQKILTFILLFFYFFNISVSIPLLTQKTFAKDKKFYDLVSIIIDEDSFKEIESELKRYSRDISSVLENTKVIIIPVAKKTEAFNIASINEALYFEWYKAFEKAQFNSRLIWTVFVWDINLPMIFNDWDSKRTVLPYTDFEDKYYIYNKKTKKYEKNPKNYNNLKPEIWHSFISPNTWNFEENIKSLKIFFDKDHDFYEWKWKYKQSVAVINWDLDDDLKKDYEPYVFYFDYFREIKALNKDSYNMYKAYKDNEEDLSYGRYTKELAKKMEKNTLWVVREDIFSLMKKLDPSVDASILEKQKKNLDNAADIQSKYPIENTSKTFLESFSKWIIWKFREDVHNAWRYNYNKGVNMDFMPYLATLIDTTSDETIKWANNMLEWIVDKAVKDAPADILIVPEKYKKKDWADEWLYENYIYWRKVETMHKALDCNITRWSSENGWKIVESNRWYNVYKSEPDYEELKAIHESCVRKDAIETWASLEWLWWKASPLYLNPEERYKFKWEINYDWAIVPLFDIKWSREGEYKAPNPDECFDDSLLLTRHRIWWTIEFAIPEYWPVNWDCFTINNSPEKVIHMPSFEALVEDPTWEGEDKNCHIWKVFLDWVLVKESGSKTWCSKEEDGPIEEPVEEEFYFKSIHSAIEHKFPTADNLKKQTESKATPSVWIDRNRYNDSIIKEKYTKIEYPNSFRIEADKKKEKTAANIWAKLDIHLWAKAEEVKEKTWVEVNFKASLLSNAAENVKAKWYTKNLNSYDMLVSSLVWKNFDITEKYPFIFENYLSENFKVNKFFLPKQKKAYEIAYIWSQWKPDSMYIWMDPREKKEGPYSDIIAKNKNLASNIFSSNILKDDKEKKKEKNNSWWSSWESSESPSWWEESYEDTSSEDSWTFECWPPDWVPIQEWMSAIKCWLSNMLPPTIEISSNECSWDYLLDIFEEDNDFETDPDFIKKQCFDNNKDWINDCLFNIETIELSSDSEKYNTNSNTALKAKVKWKNGKTLSYIDSLNLNFLVVKVDKKKDKKKDFKAWNIETIFDINDKNKNDPKLYLKYLSFKPTKIPLQKWRANYWFSSKWEELDVYIIVNSDIKDKNWNIKKSIKSNIIKIPIRKNKLINRLYKLSNKDDVWEYYQNFLEVNENPNLFLFDSYKSSKEEILNKISSSSAAKEKLVVNLKSLSSSWEFIALSYPIKAKLYLKNSLVQDLVLNRKTDFIKFDSIKKSWVYTLKIEDSLWFKTDRKITFTSKKPNDLKFILWTNMMLAWNWTSTSAFTLLDKYWNVADWDFYRVELSINWDSLVFWNNNKKSLNISTYEWYSIFRLKSLNKFWNNNIIAKVFDNSWKLLVSKEVNIKVLEDIKLDVEKKIFKVGNNKYNLELRLKDKNGKLLSNFSSRAYFGHSNNYIRISKPYFEIKNWKTNFEFETKTLAGENVPIEVQIEWINSIKYHKIDIEPGLPIKIDLIIKNPQIEANAKSFSNVQARLKDRYDNLVFTDSTTKLNIEIHRDNDHIIKKEKNNITFSKWEALFKIKSTKIPWLWFFKVSTSPSLSNNSFEIKDDSKTITVSWVWENAWEVKTVYFWNKEKLKKMHYNALYTTLLWSNYWDITKKDYLAWALIFDKNSRALAVSSIIDNPYKKNNSFFVQENWNIYDSTSSLSLDQDLTYSLIFKDKKFFVDIYNEALSHKIWELNYNFPSDSDLKVCLEDKCELGNKTSIFWKVLDKDYEFYIENEKLYFTDKKWKTYFSVSKNWEIDRRANIKLEIDSKNKENFLRININYWTINVWYIGFRFKNAEFNYENNKNLEKKENSINLSIKNNFYYYYPVWEWNEKRVNVYYNDPFAPKNNLDNFSRNNIYWYENFLKKPGIWWNEWNRTLLSFASGDTVWEATKNSVSFWLINIWDPVISLKKIKRKFKNTNIEKQFDPTIWKIINIDENVERYELFDYNWDEKEDILFIKKDDHLSLYENKNLWWWFVNMWDLVYLDDLWSYNLVKTWDFTWDKFDDIIFISKKQKIYLINNIKKDFVRQDLSKEINLSWKIIQMEVFDMDADWRDDLVTLDDSWEINIFYAEWIPKKPLFKKKNISKKFALKLSEKPRSDKSLIYFDSLYQIRKLWIKKSKKLWAKDYNKGVGKAILESMVFKNIPYSKSGSLVKNSPFWKQIVKSSSNNSIETTFIKWEYADTVWLEVEKVFKDINWWNFKSGDEVEVKIKLTNKTSKTLKNIVYLEMLENYFSLKNKSIKNSWNIEAKPPIWNYDFMIDWFSLKPSESFYISYRVKTSPLKYGHIKVWLFESGEAWDDIYWDIIVQDTYKNCQQEIDLFRSIDIREYEEWKKFIKCKENANKADDNWNGIPDKAEPVLANPEGNLEAFKEEQFAEFDRDSDGDGRVDDDDMFNLKDWKLVTDLSNITDNAEKALDKLEDLVNGLSCWFSNWACISMPLNWAPLAPWSDPVFLWKPIWDWLKVNEWVPVFSALTWVYYWPYCWPIVWPPSPLWPGCSNLWAWWYLWIDSQTDWFRLFISPTLTWWVWMAACFWAPAREWWWNPPKKISPIMPWWNCIVTAKPLFGCSDDWSDWDPESIWTATPAWWSWGWWAWGNWWFSYINWNCWSAHSEEKSLKKSYVEEILWWAQSELDYWINSESLWANKVKEAMVDHSIYDWQPLVTIWVDWWREITISASDIKNTDYSDIIKLTEKRIKAFPEFLMEWVSRQIEEIVMKLVDFPTVTIIFPDFDWIIDLDKSWKENRENWLKRSWNSGRLTWDFLTWDFIKTYEKLWVWKINSWIKEAYEFLASIPFVKVKQEVIAVNIPWFWEQDLDKTLASWKYTAKARQTELEKAKEYRAINWFDGSQIEAKVNILIGNLDANIDTIETYLQIPKKIKNLINKKQEYLEQIICNINSLLEMTWWRIWENGKRFKAWVELFILIKSILKSWQLIIEIFEWYEAECRECKNERRDLLDWEFILVNMIIPSIPVVRFPKWPDIKIDLHNIRAWVIIKLPQFEIKPNPIIIPDLPPILLPKDLNINLDLHLPDLPLLPELEIPELPDLPSLPTVDLPDLPPPPKLPKLFAGFEFIVDVAKLFLKAMCILKKSPFVPEWRAWDQIAFLTERNWFLGIDFLSWMLPQFSFPWVDSISITTYVNLEYETDFIVEMAKNLSEPLNTFTWDFTNKLNLYAPPINIRWKIPENINVDIDLRNKKSSFNLRENALLAMAKSINLSFKKLYLNKNEKLTNAEFKASVLKSLESKSLISEPKFKEIASIWEKAINYNFEKEDKIIKDLQENNREKYNKLKDIINTEIIKNKKLSEDLDKILKNSNIKVSSIEREDYNSYLEKYNKIAFEKTYNLLNSENKEEKVIKKLWKDLLNDVNNISSRYKFNKNRKYRKLALNTKESKTINTLSNADKKRITEKSCWVWKYGWNWGYVYEWIYILENGRSYRLFDHINELKWDEEIKTVDIDWDWDEDIFYFVNNVLYLKENLKEKKKKIYLWEDPYIIYPKDNKFLDNNKFLEAINNPRENISSTSVNIDFSWIMWIYNYRLSYYDIIDKFFREDEREENFIKRKNIVDWVAWIWKVNLLEKKDDFIIRTHPARIKNIWNFRDVEVYTKELKWIKKGILDGNVLFISSATDIYTWNSLFKFRYIVNWEKEIKTFVVPPNSSVEFKNSVKIIEIITWEWYVKTGQKKTYKWKDILKIKWLPLFHETKIKYKWDYKNIVKNSYIEIAYYDDSSVNIDFREIYSYEFYSLWEIWRYYLFSLKRDKNLYYGKIFWFKKDLKSTISKLFLSSPQISSDQNWPEIKIKSLKVPIYKTEKIDITKEIFENSWNNFIKEAYIDFDLEIDSDWDWILTNDRDSDYMENLSIKVENGKIIVSVWEFDKPISKKIWISVLDKNENLWYKSVKFEIYSPKPKIKKYFKWEIIWNIWEKIKVEPINIYKYRWWDLEKLLTSSWASKVFTSELWEFNFKTLSWTSDLILTSSWTKIASISENTWKIKIFPLEKSNYNIVTKLKDDLYPKIIIKSREWKNIFYESLKIKDVRKVVNIDDYSEIKNEWIYVKIFDKKKYNFYILPENIEYNPWSLVIYNPLIKNKSPLIIIFKDWRIKLNNNYKLSYSSYWDYISLKILNKNSKIIASVIYYVEWDYIIN